MTISELVKKLMDAGATADVVEIAIQAVEEEREPPPRRHVKSRKPEIVAQRA
jgi:hypothetical protein